MSPLSELLFPLQESHAPGYAALVVHKGQGRSFTHGLADLERNISIDETTNFRLCSVTKQFTAAAILLCLEEEQLSLSDELRTFFPDFPAYGKSITVLQLLTHSSGLLDYEELIPSGQTGQVLDEDVLQLLAQQEKTYFPPGARYKYSNGGYCLLRLVIEKVSDVSFSEYLMEKVFTPLGMTGTRVNHEGETRIPERAYGYSRTDAGWKLTDQNVTSATIGDGGIYSSLTDLYKWDQAISSNKLLTTKSWAAMFSPHIVTDDPSCKIQYGLGWFLKEFHGYQAAYHGGDSIGFRTGIYRLPKKDLTVIFLSNRNEQTGSLVCEEIIEAALDEMTKR